jgi:succinoglycan biosynthesis protein ExoV
LPVLDGSWKIYCVRGPITAASLNLPKQYAVTDAAALVSTVYDAKKIMRQGIAFIPHHASAWNLDWAPICAEAGIRYIDPRLGVDVVLREIAISSAIITEAMHGAIVADAFRIPWMPVVLYDHVLGFKWRDWTQSLSLSYSPACFEGVFSPDYNYASVDRLKIGIKRSFSMIGVTPKRWTPAPRRSTEREMEKFAVNFRQIVEKPRLVLSKDCIYEGAVGRLLDKLDQLKKDYSRDQY